MVFKFLVIGTLAILALSSVMNPRAFRMLLATIGALAAVFAIAAIALVTYGQDVDPAKFHGLTRYAAEWHRRLYGQPSWEEAVKTTSERALEEFKDDLKDPGRMDFTVYKYPLEVPEGPPREALAKVVPQIKVIVDQYLETLKAESADPEVQKLTAQDLDLSLLKFWVPRESGRKRLYIAFDDKFKQQIPKRARMVTARERMWITLYVCGGVGVALCIAFSVLKIVNGRARTRPERDYLRLSGVSMS